MNFSKEINVDDSLMDLTPIVDVVFNLLIFFALSLNFSQVTSSINIKLPKAKSSEIVTEKQIIVSIEKGNKIFIAVGASHLGGETGLLNQFKEAGFKLKPIQALD